MCFLNGHCICRPVFVNNVHRLHQNFICLPPPPKKKKNTCFSGSPLSWWSVRCPPQKTTTTKQTKTTTKNQNKNPHKQNQINNNPPPHNKNNIHTHTCHKKQKQKTRRKNHLWWRTHNPNHFFTFIQDHFLGFAVKFFIMWTIQKSKRVSMEIGMYLMVPTWFITLSQVLYVKWSLFKICFFSPAVKKAVILDQPPAKTKHSNSTINKRHQNKRQVTKTMKKSREQGGGGGGSQIVLWSKS